MIKYIVARSQRVAMLMNDKFKQVKLFINPFSRSSTDHAGNSIFRITYSICVCRYMFSNLLMTASELTCEFEALETYICFANALMGFVSVRINCAQQSVRMNLIKNIPGLKNLSKHQLTKMVKTRELAFHMYFFTLGISTRMKWEMLWESTNYW